MTRFAAMWIVSVASFLFASQIAVAQPEEGQYYRIKNVNSQKNLALGDKEAKEDGVQIVQRAQGQDERQQWSFVKVGKYYKIVNRKSGQALNVRSKEEYAPIIALENGKNQQWSLEPKGEAFVIRSRHSGLVIDVAGESKERKAPVIQFSDNEGRNQIFELVPVE